MVAIVILASLVFTGLRKLRLRSAVEDTSPAKGKAEASGEPVPDPEIRYCRTEDGKRIAYAITGEGTPIVRALGWFTHLETEWNSPIGRGFWQRLARDHQLVRYDGRGMGLSKSAEEFTSEGRLKDLEAVVDAAGLDRFALFALSEGARTAVRFAVKHPERITHLVLYGVALRKNEPPDEQLKKEYLE